MQQLGLYLDKIIPIIAGIIIIFLIIPNREKATSKLENQEEISKAKKTTKLLKYLSYILIIIGIILIILTNTK